MCAVACGVPCAPCVLHVLCAAGRVRAYAVRTFCCQHQHLYQQLYPSGTYSIYGITL
jgi:hypothetical protein